MLKQSPPNSAEEIRSRFFYGWVIVAVCTLMLALTYGLMYSYSVFFKPLADYFNWDRAVVSLVYSASLIIRGAVSIGVGWLADRYGSAKLMVFCGLMIGLGLVLSSQVHTLWQFFVTYAIIEAIGLSGAFGIGVAMVSRWFTKNRGLAIGITSTGSGVGTLLIVPAAERLINAFGWSQSFIICGATAGILMVAAALLLRPAPGLALSVGKTAEGKSSNKAMGSSIGANVGQALGDSRMLLFMGATLLFSFGIQITMVHVVNYATDMGISPLIAATIISIIGAASIMGRLSGGTGAEKIGLVTTLMLTRVFLVISFICLIFLKSLWSFYVFAVIFGLCYGAEIPQIPLFVGEHWGTKAMATLMGLSLFITNIGGSLGPWLAGKIFDTSQSYEGAFIAGAVAGLISLILILILRGKSGKRSEDIS